LDFPKRLTKIIVGPAMPEGGGSALDLYALAFGRPRGFVSDREAGPEVVMSTYGLSGNLTSIYGRVPSVKEAQPTEIRTVKFLDERFTYTLRLETTAADSVS